MDMDVPPLVRDRLDGESMIAHLELGGDDAVFVTPSRTLVYRAEGLLSDESVTAYPHDIERFELSRGRRKATFKLTYVDTAGKFTVPMDCADDVLVSIFDGILTAAGVTEEDERVREVYQFSELTLVITDGRLLKHVGNTLWDEDFEMYPFKDVTGLGAEEGNVATQIVVELTGRPHRVKVPSERGETVRRTIQSAVFQYHDVDSMADLREIQGASEEPAESSPMEFEEANITPLVGEKQTEDASSDLSLSDTAGVGGTDSNKTRAGEKASSPDEKENDTEIDSATSRETEVNVSSPEEQYAETSDVEAMLERLAALEATVERQTELIEAQQVTIETLVDELRRGR